MNRTLLARVIATLLAFVVSGCGRPAPAPLVPPGQQGKPDLPVGTGYYAAARVADITPPIHLSLYGHGPESRVSTGVRLRLRCEVFVIASGGAVVALVPCDLQSSSEALQRRVADYLADAKLPITADKLFIMATHSHAAPAHYFDAPRLSGSFSSMAPGFDVNVLDFLARRIAAQIAYAYWDLKPACISWQQEDIACARLGMNRSYVPFLTNVPLAPGEDDLVASARQAGREEDQRAMGAVDAPSAEGGTRRCLARATGPERAVDTTLSVLRIDRRAPGVTTCEGSAPLGALAVYGLHPTAMPNTNSLFSGDIFGYAVRAAERVLALSLSPATDPVGAASPPVIVGLVNGIEGDVSPRLSEQSDVEARRVGRILGARIAKLAVKRDGLEPDGVVARAYRELVFPGARYDDDERHHLCPTGEVGAQAAGGARDGPTRVRVIPEMNAGFIPDQLDPCQDAKMPLRNGPPDVTAFPQMGSIALVRVGRGLFATAPAEMTTMTGLRIRDAVGAHFPGPIAVVGLTNEWIEYIATPEEYRFQYYEGASTLYGPNTEPFLTRHFGCLARRFIGGEQGPLPCDLPGQPKVNEVGTFNLDHVTQVNRWPSDEEPNRQQPVNPPVERVRRHGVWGYEMNLNALPPAFTSDRDEFFVQVLDGTTVVDDDRGPSIEVEELEGGTWRVRWIPELEPRDERCCRMRRLHVGKAVVVDSKPFQVVCEGAAAGRCMP